MALYQLIMSDYEIRDSIYRLELQKFKDLQLAELNTYAATEGAVMRSFQLSSFGTFP